MISYSSILDLYSASVWKHAIKSIANIAMYVFIHEYTNCKEMDFLYI